MTKRAILTMVIPGMLLFSVLFFYYRAKASHSEWLRSGQIAWMAYRKVEVGMTLADAGSALSDAWHRTRCEPSAPRVGPFEDHLFFFGSHDLDEAGIISLRVRALDATRIVASRRLVENYELRSLYEDCLNSDPLLSQ